MISCLDVSMVWLRGFHRYKIPISANKKYDANVRPTTVLIQLDSVISAAQKTYVLFFDAIYPQWFHITPLYKKKRDGLVARPAFSAPTYGKGSPLF